MVVSASTGEAPKTWLLSGIPRSGTSLCCRLAAQLPDFVALSEPIGRDVSRTAVDPDAACKLIGHFVVEVRQRALAEGRVPSVNVAGRLDDNRVALGLSDAGLRRLRGVRSDVAVPDRLSPSFSLLVKHNALFAALLPRLTAVFPCLAIIRNPLAVLASWQTVDLPIARGRIPAGEQFDARLRADLDGEPDVVRRQVVVLNWFFGQFRAHIGRQRIIRYEQLISTSGAVLYRVLGSGDRPAEALVSQNVNGLYGKIAVDQLLTALFDARGPWMDFYSEVDCARVAETIRAATLDHGR